MKTVINIGLNVGNTEPKDQLEKTLNLLKPFLVSYEITTGEWQGNIERTVVAVIDNITPVERLSEIADMLNQEVISVMVDNEGFMIHSPKAKESYEFDKQYFQFMSKRQRNSMGLKVKFYPATNTLGARYKITQTNNGNYLFVSAYYREPIEYIVSILEKIDEIESFSLVVNNIADYHLFAIQSVGNSFPDLLKYFKE